MVHLCKVRHEGNAGDERIASKVRTSRGLEANLAIASSVISWHWSKVVVLFTALAVGLN